MGAPAQDPALHLLKVVEPHPQAGGPAAQFDQFLAGMSAAPANQVRRPHIELDHDLVIVATLEHSKTAAQIFVGIKLLRQGETLIGQLGLREPGQDKGPHGLPFEVEGKEIPMILDAGQVVGMQVPPLRLGSAQVLVEEFERPMLLQSPGENLERFQIGILRGKGSKGEDIIEAAQAQKS